MTTQISTACPICQKNLKEFALSPSLSVNRCEGCNIVWFDAGEIGTWFRTDELVAINSAMASAHQPTGSRNYGQGSNADYICPRCLPKELLSPIGLKDQTIFRCLKCMGHLVSTEGLRKFKGYDLPKPKEATITNPKVTTFVSPKERFDSRTVSLGLDLCLHGKILIKQRRELAELVGFETRNKYDIYGSDSKVIAFAAEQGKDALSMISRHFFGHWRRFQIQVFSPSGTLVLVIDHPFTFFLSRLHISGPSGEKLGTVAQNFSLLSKKLTIFGPMMNERFVIKSPIWRPWRFPIFRGDGEIGTVEKKWTGLFTEFFTDKDTFVMTIDDPKLTNEDRFLCLASALLIDLSYFEKSGGD